MVNKRTWEQGWRQNKKNKKNGREKIYLINSELSPIKEHTNTYT